MKPYTKPVTQRLRELEMAYALTAQEKSTLHRARYLIAGLYELFNEKNSAARNAEIKKLFITAGLGQQE